jgi:predicted ribosomally synthesized peptide with SipW-like signal peptide
MKSSLEHKTVRPGRLSDYSFYYSNRRPPAAQAVQSASSSRKRLPRIPMKFAVILLLVIGGSFAYFHSGSSDNGKPDASSNISKSSPAVAPVNECAGNQLDKFIKVSINARKLWACEGTKVVKTTPVITGIEKYAATETPLGTYHVYAKQADTVLTGSDDAGTWRDPVSYWMPFLDNQYGTYGFHDATWRNPNEFGTIDAHTSDNASHGCVELPLGAMGWLYNWAPTGITLTVVN